MSKAVWYIQSDQLDLLDLDYSIVHLPAFGSYNIIVSSLNHFYIILKKINFVGYTQLLVNPLNTETNIVNEHNMVKNPNWQEADQLAILQAWPRSWTQDYQEQIQLHVVAGWRTWTRDLRITRPAP